MKSRRETYTEETIAALLACARSSFATLGYDAASVETIARQAQVTTGAIYHHFSGKKGLFLAVAEQVEAELLRVAAAVTESDPWRSLRQAFALLIDACAAPDVQRIVFLEAPRVIGAEEWRAIEIKYAFGAMAAVLARLGETDQLHPHPVELSAPVLLAALAETSRFVAARPADRVIAIDLMMRVIDSLKRDR